MNHHQHTTSTNEIDATPGGCTNPATGKAASTPQSIPAPELPEDLKALFAELDQETEKISLETLKAHLSRLTFTLDDVRPWAKFDSERYRRNLIHAGPNYHALLLCWMDGQRSPIHDHRGSACGVRVVAGSLVETIFERNEAGHVFPTVSNELHEGEVCASEDADIHQVSNLQGGRNPLVTLHIYSPPLTVFGRYSLMGDKAEDFCDPVFEFCEGAGI